MRLATWNINSVRLRLSQVLRFVKEQNIDVMCLQETKTPDEFFPSKQFKNVGFTNQYFRGEKSYNGIAILSKLNFDEASYINFCGKNDTRHISVQLNYKTEFVLLKDPSCHQNLNKDNFLPLQFVYTLLMTYQYFPEVSVFSEVMIEDL